MQYVISHIKAYPRILADDASPAQATTDAVKFSQNDLFCAGECSLPEKGRSEGNFATLNAFKIFTYQNKQAVSLHLL